MENFFVAVLSLIIFAALIYCVWLYLVTVLMYIYNLLDFGDFHNPFLKQIVKFIKSCLQLTKKLTFLNVYEKCIVKFYKKRGFGVIFVAPICLVRYPLTADVDVINERSNRLFFFKLFKEYEGLGYIDIGSEKDFFSVGGKAWVYNKRNWFSAEIFDNGYFTIHTHRVAFNRPFSRILIPTLDFAK